MAGTTGLEPATSAVTGQRSNQLSYVPNSLVPAYDGQVEKARAGQESTAEKLGHPCQCTLRVYQKLRSLR